MPFLLVNCCNKQRRHFLQHEENLKCSAWLWLCQSVEREQCEVVATKSALEEKKKCLIRLVLIVYSLRIIFFSTRLVLVSLEKNQLKVFPFVVFRKVRMKTVIVNKFYLTFQFRFVDFSVWIWYFISNASNLVSVGARLTYETIL